MKIKNVSGETGHAANSNKPDKKGIKSFDFFQQIVFVKIINMFGSICIKHFP